MRRLFWLVAAVVLVDTMFFAAVSPLLPHYADELGLSKSAAGVLTAAYPAGALVGSLPGGWLAARAGVKPTLLAGLALLGVSSLVFGFANDTLLLDSARLVQGIGGAFMWTAGMAWLVAGSPRERRGELIGAAIGAAIVGVLFGPVIGGLATVVGPEPVFAGVAVLAALLGAWAWAMPGVAPEGGPTVSALVTGLRTRSVLIAFWLFSIPALFAGVLEVLAPLRLDELGASGVAVGAAFLVAAGVEAVLSPVTGRLSDRLGRLALIRVGLASAAVMGVLMPLPGTALLVAGALVATIATLGTFWAPATALVSDSAERAGLDQGLAFALTNLAWALGHMIGGGGGAALADVSVDAVPYALLSLLATVTLVGLVAPRRRARVRAGAAAGRRPG